MKRREIPEQRRQQIYAAALELFSRRGYHGVRVEEIARQAGISKGNFYWYFPSKKELFRSLVLESLQQVLQPFLRLIEENRSPEDKLLALAEASLRLGRAQRETLRLLFQLMLQKELAELLLPELRQEWQRYRDITAALFAQKGETNPRGVATAYLATLDGLTLQSLFEPELFDWDEVLAALQERFTHYKGVADEHA
jgi:TetR/AcrR family transcriptional regulator